MNTRSVTLGIIVCGLAACGGGGGGGSIPGTVSTVYPALALTAANAEAVAGEVAALGSDTVGTGDVGTGIITSVVVEKESRPALMDVARWSLDKLHTLQNRLSTSITGVIIDTTEACTGGGTVTVTGDDVPPLGVVSTGDSFTISFNSCVELGITLSGSLAITNFTLNGDPSVDIAWNMQATFTFTALTISEGLDSLRIDGGMNYSIATSDSDDFVVSISGANLAYREGGHTTTLRSFTFDYLEELSSGLYSLEYAGTADIGSLTGRVMFTTTLPVTGDLANDWPDTGVVLITGANNSSVTMTILGADAVQLGVDANGDGATDQTIDTTWTALTAL